MQIKYRIGIMPGPWPGGPPGEGVDFFWRLIDVCERTEIDSIWFSDRLSSPLPVLEPMTTMAAVAARTRRLKFGPSVLIAPFRSPVLAARQLAMLDYLSGGRVLPAVGIGVEQEREFLAAGVPFRERGRRTDEAIRVMRRCWEAPGVTFAGEFWRLERITVRARSIARPFIPRGRVDAPTLDACTAFGPAALVSERLEQYVQGGGSKFVLRPMCPPERMLEQLERLAADVIPAFHGRWASARRAAGSAALEG